MLVLKVRLVLKVFKVLMEPRAFKVFKVLLEQELKVQQVLKVLRVKMEPRVFRVLMETLVELLLTLDLHHQHLVILEMEN